MVNSSKSLINVVNCEKPNVLRGLAQKRAVTSLGLPLCPNADKTSPANRRDLRRSGMYAERGNSVALPEGKADGKEGR